MASIPTASCPLPPGASYVHGYSPVEEERLGVRTAANSAAFLLPHLRPGMALLDCGCGPGTITLDLAAVVAPGRVVGIDLEPRQVALARALGRERGIANASFEAADADALPFADGSFDAAFAHTLLLHLREPLRALGVMRRVLRPGGVVGIADDDHATVLWEPATPLLRQAHATFLRVVRHHGGDPFRARHHRALLLRAGFARNEGSAKIGSDTRGTPEGTRRFAAYFAAMLLLPSFADVAIRQGWATRQDLEAMAAEVISWAERPDAFVAIMPCAAVGWVPGG